MDIRTTSPGTLTADTISKLMDSLITEFNSEELDEFIAKGNKVEETILVTRATEMENVNKLRTKHGILKVKFSEHLPINMPTVLVRVQKHLGLDLFFM